MSLDSDPEITAAFGSSDTPTPTATVSDDPEIRSAFASTDEKKAPKTAEDHKIGDELVQPVVAGLSSALHSAIGGYKGIYTLATTQNLEKASQAIADEQKKAYTYIPPAKAQTNLGPQATAAMEDAKTLPSPTALGDFAASHGASPGLSTALAVAPTAASFMAVPRSLGPEAIAPTAEDAAATTAAAQSGGAAGAAPDVSAASAPLKSAISQAAQKTGGAVNPTALTNHLEADSLGIPLTKGESLRDPIQYGKEANSDNPLLVQFKNAREAKITDAMDRIRQEASPTNVQNSPREGGLVALNELKAYDEPIKADVKAKYQKLEDANGGAMPIDTGATASSADTILKKKSLSRLAANDPVLSEVMDNLRSGAPIDFETFENSRSLLSGIQRTQKGQPASVAAGIIRNELEKMPLPPEAAPLKAMADDARNAASARFDELKRDPAYEAAVDDVSNGNPKGKPSPLADTFLDDYALSRGAPKSEVDLMMSKLSDEGKGAVATHTLNQMRNAAVDGSTKSITPAAMDRALKKYGDKLPSLVAPETAEDLYKLNRVVNTIKTPPPGAIIGTSKTATVAKGLLKAGLETGANVKTGGMYGIMKKITGGLSDDAFAKDAIAPGAGLDQLKAKP
jgi:hypothetical protein